MSLKTSLADRLLIPIRAIIERVLPKFAHRTLDDPKVRDLIITAVDITLISEFPAARALPTALRQRITGAVLDAVLSHSKDRKVGAPEFTLESLGLKLTDRELASVAISAPGNSIRGFLMDAEVADDAAVQKAVTEVLGQDWTVERLDPELDTYRATSGHVDSILSVPDAWSLSHKLEEQLAISRAEPQVDWVPAPASIGGTPPDVRSTLSRSMGGKSHLDCSGPNDWHLTLIHAADAWEISKQAGAPVMGEGVTIGHLDTGLTYHEELPVGTPQIPLNRGKNLYDPQNPKIANQPLDPMDADFNDFLKVGFPPQNGHGTGTSSIVLGHINLVGAARNATLIPFRIAPSVVHFETQRIAEGIRAAHEAGCDVITMSMGGPPSSTHYLEKIVERAVEDGVIICTAAGNQIGSNDLIYMVVWPAALDQVIAVAGCNCQERVWSGSSRGPEVNITAAAQDVWRAGARTGDVTPGSTHGKDVSRGAGTSYATPTVASMAACWLAHHGGRVALAQHYGHPRYVALVFAQLIRTVAFHTPSGWNTKLMGPGILDAKKLLSAPLPSKANVTGWPAKDHSWFSEVFGGFFKLIRTRSKARGMVLAEPSPGAVAERFQGELAYHLFDRPAILGMAHELTAAAKVGTRGIPGSSKDLHAPDELDDASALLRTISSKELAGALKISK